MHQTIEVPGGDGSVLLLSQLGDRTVSAQVYNAGGALCETRIFEKVRAIELLRAAGTLHLFTPGVPAVKVLKELSLMHAELVT